MQEHRLCLSGQRKAAHDSTQFHLAEKREGVNVMTKCAIYARVSLPTQHISASLLPLRELAARRGFEVVADSQDNGISGTKAGRPGLDSRMADARRGKFSVVLVTAFDRIARSTRHFLQTLNELDGLGVEVTSVKESIDRSEERRV